MIWVLLIIFFIGGAALVLPDILSSQQKFAVSEREKFEAYLLAGDLVEVGKYFLFYEKIMFRDDPMKYSGGRSGCMVSLWAQSLGTFQTTSATLQSACGYYDTLGRYQGTQNIACGALSSIPAFCPSYLRSPQMDGLMLEQLLLDRWVDRNVLEADSPGSYSISIPLAESVSPSEQANTMFRLYTGQRLLANHLGGATAGLAWLRRDPNFRATVRYDFLTNAAGFTPVSSERFIKVTGTVEYSGSGGVVHRSERSNTVMLWLTTPKDFALFVPYPTKSNGEPTDAGFSANATETALDLGSNVEINGRVYFNGDFNKDLATLPVFNESVVLSGNIRDAAGNIPGMASLVTLRAKFRKGFVTNYSAPRYLNDGACAPNGPAGSTPNIEIANGTLIRCFDTPAVPFTISHYAKNINPACGNFLVTIDDGVVTPASPPTEPANTIWPESIPLSCSFSTTGFNFLAGGYRKVRAKGAYAGIMSPVEDFQVTDPTTNVYGTVFGGYIKAGNTAKFYSLSAMSPGLPGASGAITATQLQTFNSNHLTATAGVTVPLLNMPVALVTGDEAQ